MIPNTLQQGNKPPDAIQQWLSTRLKIRADLRFEHRLSGDEPCVIVEDTVRSKFFQIGLAEFRFMTELDGQRTVQEIIAALQQPPRPDQLTESLAGDSIEKPTQKIAARLETNFYQRLTDPWVIQIVRWLVQNNLAYSPDADNGKHLNQMAKQARQQKLMGNFNPIAFKVRLFNPNRLLQQIQSQADWFFSRGMLIFWFVLGGLSVHILVEEWSRITESSVQLFATNQWMWLIVAWIGLKVIHETAHGIACRRYGGEVPEAGLLLILFTPLAYVNVTSMWRLKSRWQRIVISAAGMYSELLIAFIALIVWNYYPGVIGDIAFQIFLMASVTTLLFNANPLMRFDGYFILSDLINVPNLYPKGLRWLGDRFKSLYFGTPRSDNICKPRELKFVRLYGLAAWCWKSLIGITLILAASVLFEGAGIILAALGVVLWYLFPAWKNWQWFRNAHSTGLINRQRLLISAMATVVFFLGLFFLLRSPPIKGAPAIVQYSGEQLIRAKGSGFVKQILTENGQRVRQGDLLIVLENIQLELEVFELEKQLVESEINLRIRTKGEELALAQAELDRANSLRKQLMEKREELAALLVTAPQDGVVVARNLNDRLGSFVKIGDELLSFADSDSHHMIVSIDQRDWESIKGREGAELQVLLPGRQLMRGSVKRIFPAATSNLTHPALGGNMGGPLPVKMVAQSSSSQGAEPNVELLSPRFSIELELPQTEGERFYSGQLGWVYFQANRQSLGIYLYLWITEWVEEKLKLAKDTSTY